MGNMFWFITFLVFLFLELITVNLVTVWFATGALVSFVISLFIDNFFLEVFCFIIVSILMLITTKPMLKKIKRHSREAFNYERIIGKEGIVLKDIRKHQPGEVKVMGSVWTAVSSEEILQSEEVKVLKVEGVKVEVIKVNHKEE